MERDANDVLSTLAGETSQVTTLLLFYYVNEHEDYLNQKIKNIQYLTVQIQEPSAILDLIGSKF